MLVGVGVRVGVGVNVGVGVKVGVGVAEGIGVGVEVGVGVLVALSLTTRTFCGVGVGGVVSAEQAQTANVRRIIIRSGILGFMLFLRDHNVDSGRVHSVFY
jgi:hypothetical protein